jgi:hypothetical protein
VRLALQFRALEVSGRCLGQGIVDLDKGLTWVSSARPSKAGTFSQ